MPPENHQNAPDSLPENPIAPEIRGKFKIILETIKDVGPFVLNGGGITGMVLTLPHSENPNVGILGAASILSASIGAIWCWYRMMPEDNSGIATLVRNTLRRPDGPQDAAGILQAMIAKEEKKLNRPLTDQERWEIEDHVYDL